MSHSACKPVQASVLGARVESADDIRRVGDAVRAAREGLGDDSILLVDAGTVWVADVERARAVLPALKRVRATWLEEPFVSGALDEYRALAQDAPVEVDLAALRSYVVDTEIRVKGRTLYRTPPL